MNKARLLNAAKAVRESPKPGEFTMEIFGKSEPGSPKGCGTPCCVLGHYASRVDLQEDFELIHDASMPRSISKLSPKGLGNIWTWRDSNLGIDSELVLTHFDISRAESFELFGPNGCGNAKTPEAAAYYIEKFVQDSQLLHYISKELGL